MQKCFNGNNTHKYSAESGNCETPIQKRNHKNDLRELYENLSSNPIYTTHMLMHTMEILDVRKFESPLRTLRF
jgi:hypothetical protein